MTGRSRRHRVLWSLLLLFALGVSACARGDEAPGDGPGADRPPIRMGSADFSESVILAEIYAQALEAEGYTVTRQLRIGPREIYVPALESDRVDMVPEYVEAIYRHVTQKDGPDDRDELETALGDALEAKGLTTLEASEAENRDGIAVTKQTAERLGVSKVSDLEGKAGDLVFGGPPECPERPACLKGLQETYGLRFKEFKALEAGVRYAAVASGEIDVIQVFTTDGPIAERDLVVLDDDKAIAGDQRIVPVVRTEIVDAYGDRFVDLVNRITAELTTGDLTDMNKKVDVDKQDPEQAAKDWLEENDLLS